MIKVISYQSDYKADPMSRKDIREVANLLKGVLEIPQNQLYIDVVAVLEQLCDQDEEMSFEIIDDQRMPSNVHAKSDVDSQTMYIKESVYNGAAENNGRDRMTIAHEIFHLLVHQRPSLVLYRRDQGQMKTYENPEWQADCFAGEFLMPHDEIAKLTTSEVMEYCKVSEPAANYQLKH